jgi:peptidoglycan/xylan/chitin deacetylase (PgdA/CDA1 family)
VQVAIKIDVDTRIGTVEGVPRLLAVFARHGVEASFYAVLGPDNSGKAIRRVFTRKGFVGKMARTNPLRIYGLKTLLYGTLLPAPMTGLAHPDVLRRVVASGHELGLHGYDHVDWHDHASDWGVDQAVREFARGAGAFGQVMGHAPAACAAPGWQATAATLEAQERHGLAYASDCRGRAPFYPDVRGQRFRTLQIPGTLPTIDELLGRDGCTASTVTGHLESLLDLDRLNVYTGHAEIEGMFLAGPFEELVARLARRGAKFVTLAQVAASVTPGDVEVCEVAEGPMAGRAGLVACQGAAVARGRPGDAAGGGSARAG